MTGHAVDLTVNGEPARVLVDPRKSLADALREDLSLPGTKLGCEHGVCGACTVLVDGAAVRSCLIFAVQAEGTDVRTVEGLTEDGALGPIHEAFRRHHALQCGFCTPGFLATITDLMQDPDGSRMSEEEVRVALGGIICRCTGYHGIVAATLELLRGSHEEVPEQ